MVFVPYAKDPIQIAANTGNARMVEYLIKQGARINYTYDSPLIGAVSNGHFVVVKILVKNGAKLNEFYNSYMTPLHAALKSKYYEIAKYLLKHHADPNYSTWSSRVDNIRTPFWIALDSGRLDVIECMLKEGADTSGSDYSSSENETSIQWAARTGHNEILICLLKYTQTLERDINLDKGKGSALHLAASNGNKKCVDYLIDCVANVNLMMGVSRFSYKDKGDLPLHCAARGGHLKIVKALVEKTENINQHNDEGLTPLQVAIEEYRTNVVRYLQNLLKQNQGAQVSEVQDVAIISKQDLIRAAKEGDIKTLRGCIEKLGKVPDFGQAKRKKYYRYSVLLQLALENHHFDVAEYLLKNGDYTQISFLNITEARCEAVKNFFIKNKEKYELSLCKGDVFSLIKRKHTELIKFYGENKAIAREDYYSFGNAIESGCLDMVKYFVEKLDCNVRGKAISFSGADKPIKTAIKYDHLEIVDFLITHDVDVNAICGSANWICSSA